MRAWTMSGVTLYIRRRWFPERHLLDSNILVSLFIRPKLVDVQYEDITLNL